ELPEARREDLSRWLRDPGEACAVTVCAALHMAGALPLHVPAGGDPGGALPRLPGGGRERRVARLRADYAPLGATAGPPSPGDRGQMGRRTVSRVPAVPLGRRFRVSRRPAAGLSPGGAPRRKARPAPRVGTARGCLH